MSGKDETDLVQNKGMTMENSTSHLSKPNQANQDLSNGDATATVNGNSSNNLDENHKHTDVESTDRKPNTPSNWVQFGNEDDSDKV